MTVTERRESDEAEADDVCIQKADGSGFRFNAADAEKFLSEHADEGYEVVECPPDPATPAAAKAEAGTVAERTAAGKKGATGPTGPAERG